MSSTISTCWFFFSVKLRRSWNLPSMPLDIHGGQAQLAAHFIARHDAAHRRRDDGGEFRPSLLRALWRPAPCTIWRCAWHPGTPAPSAGTCRNASPDDRMKWPSSKRAGLSEFVQNLFERHALHLRGPDLRRRARARPIRPPRSRVAHPGCSANARRRAPRYRPGIRKNSGLRSATFMLKMLPPLAAMTVDHRGQRARLVLHAHQRRARPTGPASAALRPQLTSSQSSMLLRLVEFVAVDGVDDDALARHHQAHDAVARQRMAALAEVIGNAFRQAANGDRLVRSAAVAGAFRGRRFA